MAQSMKTMDKPHRRKREPFAFAVTEVKKRQPRLPLYFPPDAEALLTPFRARALQRIYEIAHQHLGDRIKSTVVLVDSAYDEPERITLVLAIWADVDEDEWVRADRAIGEAVFEEESSWTADEREDYLDIVHFEILPLDI